MSSVFATTTAGTLGVSVGPPGYNIATTGLAPLTTSDGYYIYRFHSSGTMTISGITAKRGAAQLQIMCVGGGSSGIGGSFANGGGLGGSGGGFLESTVALSQAQTINITVGNGGSAADSPLGAFTVNNGENSTVSFSANTEYNMISYGGTGTMSGAPTANAPGTTFPGFPGYGGGGGAGGVGANGDYQVGGNGGPGKKPTKPGILTYYPTIYWGGGGGGATNYSFAGNGGLGGGGGGFSGSQGFRIQGANGYGGTAIYSPNAQINSGSGGGGRNEVGGGGGSGIVMIAVKIPV